MSECAECGASGQMYIVPADRDLLCWTCFYRRLGGVGDVPEHDQAGLETVAELKREYAQREGIDTQRTLPPPSAPMDVARRLVAEHYKTDKDVLMLRHWRGGWWEWQGPKWQEVEQRAVRATAYRFTETAMYMGTDGLSRWEPDRNKIANVLDALAAIVLLPENVSMPSWLDDRDSDDLVVSVANGLLDVDRRQLLAHDPRFFNATSVPFDFDADAVSPEKWQRFLADLWSDDEDSRRVLAEWFGYVISGRLDLHKIMLIVGPTRAGKGVISRILGRLVGADNVAGPTLSSLSGDFGLAPLLGKSLAVVSDARLNGRGAHVVVERLLSISGEDTLTVNRKYRDQWTGKLPARLMLCSNELPSSATPRWRWPDGSCRCC